MLSDSHELLQSLLSVCLFDHSGGHFSTLVHYNLAALLSQTKKVLNTYEQTVIRLAAMFNEEKKIAEAKEAERRHLVSPYALQVAPFWKFPGFFRALELRGSNT
jgi:hypothetical protein